MTARFGLLFVLALAVWTQDAGMVLSTSVAYTTMAATTPLTPEKKAEVDRLRQEAMAAGRAGKHGEALKHLYHGMALMRGLEWTPAIARTASLSLQADHAIWEPGQPVRLRLEPLFETEAGEPVEATVRLRPEKGDPIVLRQWTLNGNRSGLNIEVPKLPAGKFRLEVSVPPVPQPKSLNVAVEPGLRKRVEKLQSRLAKLKAPESSGLWTAQYAVELFERADRSRINPASFDFNRELSWGEQVTEALEAKRDPFAGRVGDMRRAYRSAVDNTLQPYRLYVPSSYKPAEPAPLVVALHGMGGDENTLFDRYGTMTLQKLAEQYGFFVVTPKGREPASMYRGDAERDVLDVIAEVRAAYRIDPSRIYLTGHSMGGFGTWSIAMNHPDLFAALAPFAGGGNPLGMEKIRHIPQFVVHGDADHTVPVRSSQVMVEAARKLGAEVEYVEVKGGGHVDVVVPAWPRLFEWLSGKRKPQ